MNDNDNNILPDVENKNDDTSEVRDKQLDLQSDNIDLFDFEESVSKSVSNDNAYNMNFDDVRIQPESVIIPDYEPIGYSDVDSHKTSSKGIKVFAVILSAVILLTGSCLVGYFCGINTSKRSSTDLYKDTTLNLAAKPADTDEFTAAQVYSAVNESVVGITVYGSDGTTSTASGVIYTNDGYIITNDHIYDGVIGAKFLVRTFDGKEFPATFVAGDVRSDLAVLKVNGNNFIPAVFGDDKQIVIGENVVAIGRPNNIEENSITEGIISLRERRVSTTSSYSMKMIQTSTPINPGNSGGALVNMYGQVIGITSSKIAGDEYEGIGFAIPSTTTKRIIESLIKNGYVSDRARLGVSYHVVNTVTKELGGYPSTGIIIATVDTDSDLYGKINVEDMITQVDGVDIVSDSVILDAIERSKPGDVLSFTVYTKSGKYKTINAKLLPDTGSSSYIKQLIE